MVVSDSDVLERAKINTPYKRIEQIGLIKWIQKIMRTKTPKGDLIQTPGPGNVANNYGIFERMFHENTEYHAVEGNSKCIKGMRDETYLLRKKLKEQPEYNKVVLHESEFFKYTSKHILTRNILLADACFCKTPRSQEQDGLLGGLKQLLVAKKYNQKEPMFFAWTFTQRMRNSKDDNTINKINNIIENYNGDLFYDCSYKDGPPMRSMAWQIN